jgi:nicotinamidase-related amidase
VAARDVILTGVETDVCVLATAIEAMEAGLRVILASDALTSSSLSCPCQGARHPA